MNIRPYQDTPSEEFRTWLDLPKHQYFRDTEKYPEVPGLKNTFGWFEVRRMPCEVFAVAEPRHEENGCFYVALGKDKALVFDTGLGIYDPEPLVEELAAGREIIVVNSHSHFDHTGGNHFFGKAYIRGTDLVKEIASRGLHNDVVRFQVRDEAFPMGVPAGFDQEAYGIEPFAYEEAEEGMTYDLGERKLEVMYTPGHSPDSICLLDRKNDLVLAGDTFYLGALYCHFPDSDMEAYSRTMHRLLHEIKDETKLLCCHNEFMTDGRKIRQASDLFDAILSGRAESDDREESQLNFGEEGDVRQVFGEGFSILYAKT